MPAAIRLSPQAAEWLFYEMAAGLALVTVAVMLGVYRRRRRRDVPLEPEAPARQWLIYGLGSLWLLDGLLQAQPSMITRFVGGVLAPLLVGQPAPVAWLIHVGARLWSLDPVVWNVLAVFTQIGMGLGILFGLPTGGRRVALWISLLWGGMIWIVGEGLGGLLVAGGWLTGAPGSALLYMAVAVLLLMRGSRGTPWLRWGIVMLFALNGLLQAWPGSFWWGSGLPGYVQAMAAMPQPSLFSAPLYGVAQGLGAAPAAANGVIVVVLLGLAVLWIIRPRSRAVWWASLIWVFLGWWLGQDFGVLGGMGTDPNTGAIFLLGLAAYGAEAGWIRWPARSPRVPGDSAAASRTG